MDLKMRYKHDCDKCKPLGQFDEYDLYFCNQGGRISTVIARDGDEESDYISGLHVNLFQLKIAQAMAIELGYMDDSL